jgi:tritrans,polycis-undecaprenyl-diphosphate synthase [geranylgeranyl-diphosphate specific]
MKTDAVRKRVEQLGERAIETDFARGVIHTIKRNKLFRLVRQEMQRIRAKKMMEDIRQYPVPRHLAVIMDGNRRYAFEEGLSPQEGHRIGGSKLEEVVEWCHEVGIEGLTVFAFSTDNFKRSPGEVEHLMHLFAQDLRRLAKDERIHEHEIRVRVIGETDVLPDDVVEAAAMAEEATRGHEQHYFNIAIGYGGREEIVEAVRQIAEDVKNGEVDPGEVQKDLISSYLYTADSPDPDLILRTSGEERISNFLLWQLAYAELYFSDVYWPAMKKTDFLNVIQSYQKRQRRYGT